MKVPVYFFFVIFFLWRIEQLNLWQGPWRMKFLTHTNIQNLYYWSVKHIQNNYYLYLFIWVLDIKQMQWREAPLERYCWCDIRGKYIRGCMCVECNVIPQEVLKFSIHSQSISFSNAQLAVLQKLALLFRQPGP